MKISGLFVGAINSQQHRWDHNLDRRIPLTWQRVFLRIARLSILDNGGTILHRPCILPLQTALHLFGNSGSRTGMDRRTSGRKSGNQRKAGKDATKHERDIGWAVQKVNRNTALSAAPWCIIGPDMDLPSSPLAVPFPDIPNVPGVTLRVSKARYRDWDRHDLTFVELAQGTAVAGVFTTSACASSEVEMGREQVKAGVARALIVNAGNSNAFTGHRGRAAVDQIVEQVADHLGCPAAEVFVSSTGVIGEPLPRDRAKEGVALALGAAPCDWETVTHAIGTTDTFPKGAVSHAMIGGAQVPIVGIVKGSGMIAPDMATMLGYVFTDATVAPALLQEMLTRAVSGTFNAITVDGDTSTSDTVLAFATGAGDAPALESWDSPGADAFFAGLKDVCRELAHLVVRDGEGATKFIAINVAGAASDESARKIGLSIANSPLVKTAIAGEDANWGRVVMAVGKAGEPADRDKLSIGFGGVWAARNGQPVDGYDEAPVAQHLKGEEISVEVELGIGDGQATVWTCDLTHQYIAINADYRS